MEKLISFNHDTTGHPATTFGEAGYPATMFGEASFPATMFEASTQNIVSKSTVSHSAILESSFVTVSTLINK